MRREGWIAKARRARAALRDVLTFVSGGRPLHTLGRGLPPSLMVALIRADALQRQFRLDEAVERWHAIWTSFPDHAVAVAGYGAVLGRLNRGAEAEAVLAAGEAKFPDAANILIERIRIAEQRGDYDGAVALAQRAIAIFPTNPQGYVGGAKAMWRLLRFDDADQLLAEAAAVLPPSLVLCGAQAATADMRGDWAEALRRWQAILAAYPHDAVGYAGTGAALRRLKRFDEADRVLGEGLARFPRDANLGINYAWVADERGAFGEALDRWTRVQARFPHHALIRTLRIESQGRASLAAIDTLAEARDRQPATEASAPNPDESAGHQHRDLFMRFESLGENCEFGYVQRHFGAEPIGLLRWAGIDFETLLKGLDCGFEGVGSRETTEMKLNPSNHEYYTTDKVYGLNMHTFIQRDDGNEERIYGRLCRRMTYLADKLVDDLKAGERIFVYQSALDRTDEDLRTLHAAMRRYGPATLLFVRLARGPDAAGSVRLLQEGLLAGFIDQVGFDGRSWTISFDLWLTLCQQTERLTRASSAAALSHA